MKPIRCILGLHKGKMVPAHELEQDIEGQSAYKCSRCGHIDPAPPLITPKTLPERQ